MSWPVKNRSVAEASQETDLDLGYPYAPTSQPAWRESLSPPLSARLNWYGAYDFSQGRCLRWQDGPCHRYNTLQFLNHVAVWLGDDDRSTIIIWDGAPWPKFDLDPHYGKQLVSI